MLNWWMGKSVEGVGRVEDGQEPPETPAPVFAARAVKRAIFGTPAHLEEDTIVDGELRQDMYDDDIMDAIARNASPLKPAGILLTPGTAAARRKTVSFGHEVVDNEGKDKVGKSGIPSDCPGKFPSPWSAKSTRKTALTRTLENARNSKTEKPVSLGRSLLRHEVLAEEGTEEKYDYQSKDCDQAQSQPDDDEFGKQYIPREEFDGDMTLDINEPHSQSGKFWKDNYDRYHEEAKAEMKKLLKYKQLAKSYAKKKDAEAIDLGEKLKEEQRKVSFMEHNISELVAQIASIEIEGGQGNTSALMKELARQTAMAVQYKALVEELQEEHDGKGEVAGKRIRETKYASPGEERKFLETQQNPEKLREQLQELASLRSEVHNLKLTLSASERENRKLGSELSRTKLELERSEKRRQGLEEGRQKRDEMLDTLQKEYNKMKTLAKQNREYGVELATKKNDQVRQLKTELLEAQHSIEAYEALVSGKTLGATTTRKSSEGRDNLEATRETRRYSSRNTVAERRISNSQTNNNENANPDPREEDGPSKDVPSIRNSRSDGALAHTNTRTNHLALSEIVNNADSENRIQKRELGSLGVTPLANRFSDLTLDSPQLAVPSPEPSLPALSRGKSIHEKTCSHASPRPSMFTYPSSPPKMTAPRSQKHEEALQQVTNDESKTKPELSRQNSTNELSGKATLLARQRSTRGLNGQAGHLSRQKSTSDLLSRGALSTRQEETKDSPSRSIQLLRQKSTGDLASISSRQEMAGNNIGNHQPLRQKIPNDLGGTQPSFVTLNRVASMDGSRLRSSMPPERAAAAKARLEQRMAEKRKKRAQETELGKENIGVRS